jgi:hypothetical protein
MGNEDTDDGGSGTATMDTRQNCHQFEQQVFSESGRRGAIKSSFCHWKKKSYQKQLCHEEATNVAAMLSSVCCLRKT